MDRLTTLTGANFDQQVLRAGGPIAVEFMSYGCAHCRVIEPVLQQVAEMVAATEKLFRVNIAVEQGLAEQYGIRGTPTLLMFLDGREVGRVEGPSPTAADLLRAVTAPFEA